MKDPHVAVVELDDAYFMVAGLSLGGLMATSAQESGPERLLNMAFADTASGLVCRTCQEAGCDLVLRLAVGASNLSTSLVLLRSTRQRDDAVALADQVVSAASLLARWQAAPLDRQALDDVLAQGAAWEAARVNKPAACLRVPQTTTDVPLWTSLDADLDAWSRLGAAGEFVLDLAIFPLQSAASDPATVADSIRTAAATSKVVARRVAEHRDVWLANSTAGERLLAQGVVAGVALTLFAPDATLLAGDLRPFRHPLYGPIRGHLGWSVLPDEMSPEQLAFFALDYAAERESPEALEPDPRRALGLPPALAFAIDAWRGRPPTAAQVTDAWGVLLQRIEAFEQRVSVKLDELREAVEVAKINLKSGLGHARRISETMVEGLFRKHLPNEGKKPLFNMIEGLRESGKIPSNVASLMHTVRVFGNVGAHHSEHEVGTEHLFLVIDALCLLMQWYLEQESAGA